MWWYGYSNADVVIMMFIMVIVMVLMVISGEDDGDGEDDDECDNEVWVCWVISSHASLGIWLLIHALNEWVGKKNAPNIG